MPIIHLFSYLRKIFFYYFFILLLVNIHFAPTILATNIPVHFGLLSKTKIHDEKEVYQLTPILRNDRYIEIAGHTFLVQELHKQLRSIFLDLYQEIDSITLKSIKNNKDIHWSVSKSNFNDTCRVTLEANDDATQETKAIHIVGITDGTKHDKKVKNKYNYGIRDRFFGVYPYNPEETQYLRLIRKTAALLNHIGKEGKYEFLLSTTDQPKNTKPKTLFFSFKQNKICHKLEKNYYYAQDELKSIDRNIIKFCEYSDKELEGIDQKIRENDYYFFLYQKRDQFYANEEEQQLVTLVKLEPCFTFHYQQQYYYQGYDLMHIACQIIDDSSIKRGASRPIDFCNNKKSEPETFTVRKMAMKEKKNAYRVTISIQKENEANVSTSSPDIMHILAFPKKDLLDKLNNYALAGDYTRKEQEQIITLHHVAELLDKTKKRSQKPKPRREFSFQENTDDLITIAIEKKRKKEKEIFTYHYRKDKKNEKLKKLKPKTKITLLTNIKPIGNNKTNKNDAYPHDAEDQTKSEEMRSNIIETRQTADEQTIPTSSVVNKQAIPNSAKVNQESKSIDTANTSDEQTSTIDEKNDNTKELEIANQKLLESDQIDLTKDDEGNDADTEDNGETNDDCDSEDDSPHNIKPNMILKIEHNNSVKIDKSSDPLKDNIDENNSTKTEELLDNIVLSDTSQIVTTANSTPAITANGPNNEVDTENDDNDNDAKNNNSQSTITSTLDHEIENTNQVSNMQKISIEQSNHDTLSERNKLDDTNQNTRNLSQALSLGAGSTAMIYLSYGLYRKNKQGKKRAKESSHR